MEFPSLFKPLKIDENLVLENRVVMASLTRNRAVAAPDYKFDLRKGTVPSQPMKDYYVQRAQGGTGLILTEGTLISPQGTQWANAPGIWDHEHALGWKTVVDAVHEAGNTAIFAQLWHVGRVSHPDMPQQGGKPVLAPSAIAANGGSFHDLGPDAHYEEPVAMTEQQIKDAIADYKAAAFFAKEAGFDGIELHGANGYLPHQFLDSSTNHRTDSYGGSVENRARFTLEVLKVLIDVYGSKRVGIKISPSGGYNDVGMPEKDTIEQFSYLFTEISKLHLAYVQLAGHSPMMDPTGRGTPMDLLKVFKPFIKNSLVFYNVGLQPESAHALVESGEIDAAVFGRPLINNPDFANRVKSGKPLDTVPIDWTTLYSSPTGEVHSGYTTYIPEGGIVASA